jgi:phthalate 4,5-cis-dihydrodiol dehydrogenase
VLPVFEKTPNVQLAGAADVRKEALEEFRAKYDGPAYESVEAMCRNPDIDAVWVCTPNALHAEHTILAANHGKHVIMQKPMAVTLEECDAMIEAAEKNHIKLVQGHSKIYNAPIKKMREIVNSGRLGRLIQINTWNYKGWLQVPRLASEVDTAVGGGVVYRQGPHQTDILRCIGGGMVKKVRAITGRWDPWFATEGNYTAFLEFDDGTPATMVLNCYGFFDMIELTWGIGEGGGIDPPRRARYKGSVEPSVKYSTPTRSEESRKRRGERKQPFFGLTLVSCERGDIRQSPDGLYVYTEHGREEIPCAKEDSRGPELAELQRAVAENRRPFPDGGWGKATMEVVLAVLRSSREKKEVDLHHQVPYPE